MTIPVVQYNRIEIIDCAVKVKSKDFSTSIDICYIAVVLTVWVEE